MSNIYYLCQLFCYFSEDYLPQIKLVDCSFSSYLLGDFNLWKTVYLTTHWTIADYLSFAKILQPISSPLREVLIFLDLLVSFLPQVSTIRKDLNSIWSLHSCLFMDLDVGFISSTLAFIADSFSFMGLFSWVCT